MTNDVRLDPALEGYDRHRAAKAVFRLLPWCCGFWERRYVRRLIQTYDPQKAYAGEPFEDVVARRVWRTVLWFRLRQLRENIRVTLRIPKIKIRVERKTVVADIIALEARNARSYGFVDPTDEH